MKKAESAIRILPSIEEAQEVQRLFLEEGINSKIIDNSSSLDASFIGATYDNKIEVVIANKHFGKAEFILSKNAEEVIREVDKEHYLFNFSNEELYDILLKPDEWSEFDYLLSKKILKERGKNIDEEFNR